MNLAQYLNKTILACIPTLHDDHRPHPYKLVGIELNGLWLEGEEFSRGLAQPDGKEGPAEPAAAFVPLAQIAYVLGVASTLSPLEVTRVLEKAEGAPRRPERTAEGNDAHADAVKAPPKPKGS